MCLSCKKCVIASESEDLVFRGQGFPGSSDGKASAYSAGDLGSIPGLGRSPGEGNGNPLQYSCLENPMDRGAWWATAHGVAKSQTRLSDFISLHFTFSSCFLEKEYTWCWERLRVGREGNNRGWDVGWHHQLDGHEFEQTLRDGEGQGSLACCMQSMGSQSWTKWLNNSSHHVCALNSL